jgi:hypothetical protein
MPYAVFARQSVGQDNLAHSGERLINWYLQAWPSGGQSPGILAPCPGIARFKLVGGGEVMAMQEAGAFLFIAAGGRLWRMDSARNLVDVGAIAVDPATRMAASSRDLAVCAGGVIHVYRLATEAFSIPTRPAFGAASSVAFINGYCVASQRFGDRFAWSALDDALTWNALDFAQAESRPDQLRAMVQDHQELWLFGERSTEIWFNSGGSPSIFERAAGGIIERGIAWPATARKDDNAVFWVGDDRIVYRATGAQAVRVSTEAVEGILRGYVLTDDVTAFTYTWKGHKFYVLRFTDRPAWCLDLATGAWHERTSSDDGGRWVARCAAFYSQNVQAVGLDTGVIGEFRAVNVDDTGNVLVREGVSMPLNNAAEHVTLSRVAAKIEGDLDPVTNAQVVLQVSRDGGQTWGPERWRSIGRLGARRTAEWHALGRSEQHRVRIRVTDDVYPSVAGVEFTLTP